MAINEQQKAVVNRIDELLREGGDRNEFLLDFGQYQPWYSRLLGALSVVIGQQEVAFAQVSPDSEIRGKTIVVFADRLLVHVRITALGASEPQLSMRTISRRGIRSLGVSITDPVDSTDERGLPRNGWPGQVTVEIQYEDLLEPVVLRGGGVDLYQRTKFGPIIDLVDTLREDLSR